MVSEKKKSRDEVFDELRQMHSDYCKNNNLSVHWVNGIVLEMSLNYLNHYMGRSMDFAREVKENFKEIEVRLDKLEKKK